MNEISILFKRSFQSVLLCFILMLFVNKGFATVIPSDLKCEYRTNPLGIDNIQPRLSWKIIDNNAVRGQKQTAFQIIVASSKEKLENNIGDLWDSGKIESTQSVNNVYAGTLLKSGQQCYWKVRVWDAKKTNSNWSAIAKFTIGLLQPEDWKGDWIYKHGQNKKDHNWYRKNFKLEDVASSALVYVASFGYHELYVNGEKVTNGVMNPAYSFMKKRLPYLTYDIQKFLKKGNNVIGIWHAGGWTRWGRMVEYHDAPFVFKAQTAISVGSKEHILITDKTWKSKKSYSSYIGPWDILNFGGEIIDERLREDDWNTIEYNDSNWANAVVFDQATAIEVGNTDLYLGMKGAEVVQSTDANPPTSKITATLSSQMVEAQVKFKTVTPIGVKKNDNGTYLIDMGENYTGLFEMDLFNGKEGDTLTFEIADQLSTTSSFKQKSQYIYMVKRVKGILPTVLTWLVADGLPFMV